MRAVIFSALVNRMTLYQKMLVFYAIMASVCALITWFLSKDRKRIRLLSAFLVGSTWPMSFPVALLISLF
ncbi:YdcX [Enterobacter ludwigii]|uniref:YdcX n=5 Tax=Enterobacter TaxID=547 RepID=G8LD09_9ENTR|nr:YdcX [Enterobacter ludwigii]